MQQLPIFQHDPSEPRNAMSRLLLSWKNGPLPAFCVFSFMGDVVEEFSAANNCEVAEVIHSETRDYSLYICDNADIAPQPFCLIHGPVGGPASAILLDYLIASGVSVVIACGGCGVLTPIDQGKLLVVTDALRDEGTSFHYMEPSVEVALSPTIVKAAVNTLQGERAPYALVKTWTSDAIFRETPSAVELRRSQGCDAVDMECASLAAVALCYGAQYGQLLYSGDSLVDPENHQERAWIHDISARKACFLMAVEVLKSRM